MTGIDLNVAGYIGEKDKVRKPIPGDAVELGAARQEAFENEPIKQIKSYIKDKAKSDEPFFIYWASYAHLTSITQTLRPHLWRCIRSMCASFWIRAESKASRKTLWWCGGATTDRCMLSGQLLATLVDSVRLRSS